MCSTARSASSVAAKTRLGLARIIHVGERTIQNFLVPAKTQSPSSRNEFGVCHPQYNYNSGDPEEISTTNTNNPSLLRMLITSHQMDFQLKKGPFTGSYTQSMDPRT